MRVIAATNRDLEARVKAGAFRADLLYRLRVIQLHVPPLRERAGDARLLAQEFLARFAKRYGKSQMRFTPAALDALDRHTWPGNVRELRNQIEQSVLLACGSTLDVDDLALPPAEPLAIGALACTDTLELPQIERATVLQALERTDWNVTQAARLLGISRDTLRYRIEKHGLERPQGTAP